MTENYSTIKIRENQESKIVKIGSELKPTILEEVINKWQSLIDIIAKIMNVPSGLIIEIKQRHNRSILKK